MMEAVQNPELWGAAMAVLTALAGLAVVVTKLTPSAKDDEYASKFLKFVQWIGGLVGAKPKA
jgi:hypothetical protein